jgi:hypothetical protein
VVGASIASVLATTAVAAGMAPREVTFTAVIAVVLLLRARTHSDPPRRAGLTAAGVLTVAVGVAAVAVALPSQAYVVSVLAAAAAVSCVVRVTVTPMVARTLDVVEYLALAAVVPLACWVGGIYEMVRGMTLI